MCDDGDGGRRVIELGPGQGALTRWLFDRYPSMTAVELDGRMAELLRTEYPQLALVEEDMLKLDLGGLAAERGRLALVSNTPFYLTSPLLYKMLGSLEHVESATLTMQKEVRERILASEGSKRYGILSVMLQLFGRPDHLFDIPPEAFSPVPSVDSSVVRFSPTPTAAGATAPMPSAKRAELLALLKLAFESRRKTLRATLKPLLRSERVVTAPPDEMLAKRPEQLPPAAFIELAAMLFGEGDEGGGVGILAEGHASKSWRPHKAGYLD